MEQQRFEEKREPVFGKKEWLESWLDTYGEEAQLYCDFSFASRIFDLDGKAAEEALHGGYFPIPYWLETYQDETDTIETGDDWLCQYVFTWHDSIEIGSAVTISMDGEEKKEYEYITSQALGEEMEHQAEDGGCVYEYRGPSFLRVFAPFSTYGGTE